MKAPLGEGVVGLLATLAAAGSTLLMLHFLHRLRLTAAPDPEAAAPAGLAWPWLAMAFAAVAVPWALFLAAGIGTLAEALAPADLWKGALAGAARRRAVRRACAAGETACRACRRATWWCSSRTAARASVAWGGWLERAEGVLRQWPVAGVALLALVMILGAAILGHVP